MFRSICDAVGDLVDNSLEAQASEVQVRWVCRDGVHEICVEDTGPGMTLDEICRAVCTDYTDGIKHPGRSVGLGLPWLKQLVKQGGGILEVMPRESHGLRVTLRIRGAHLPPVGDFALMVVAACAKECPAQIAFTLQDRQTVRSWDKASLEARYGSLLLPQAFKRAYQDCLSDIQPFDPIASL